MGLLSVPPCVHRLNWNCFNLEKYRALGTALEWPEAKKKADLVRQWGIEVRTMKDLGVIVLTNRAAIDRKLEAGQGERTRRPTLG